MKRAAWITLFVLLFSQTLWGAPPGFSGGVNDESEYKEVVFLSGEPIIFKGTIKVSEKEKNDEKTTKYTFSLVPEDQNINGSLRRNITIVTTYAPDTDKGQTTTNTVVDKYNETVVIGEDTYRAIDDDIQFSQSDVIDNRPAADFYSGNIQARKRYKINGSEGTATVDITGGDVGYKNFWGNTETQIIDYVYTVDRGQGDNNLSWTGTVRAQVSDSNTKSLKYSANEANFSSFNGGYIRTTNEEMVSQYTYNLPRITDGEFDSYRRNADSVSLSTAMVPKVERLIVPKFRDTIGHWAQKDIEKLYSLDVFEGSQMFFIPDVPMTRMEFVKAVVKACDIRVEEEATKRTSRRKKPVEEVIFIDVQSSDPNFQYIKDAYNKSIITGNEEYKFRPDDGLTRGEAITILIRALGFENKAPSPGYSTHFADDRKIPNWARDAVYMASEIGIVGGDENNNINAGKIMTRAEASSMIVRFLDFLEKDLQKDYRENIIYFN